MNTEQGMSREAVNEAFRQLMVDMRTKRKRVTPDQRRKTVKRPRPV